MTAPLAAMAAYPQWINWKEVPNPKRPTPDKVPTNDQGWKINPHDPKQWGTYDEKSTNGLPLAFVFTENDPFFFVDIDGCLQESGSWSNLAMDLCNRFIGCAIEVSHNRRGLHIFGVSRNLYSGHRTQDKSLGLELYTKLRFVAIGTGQIGDSGTDATDALGAALNDFLPGKTLDVTAANWTTEPVAEWSGPGDDDELIALMLRAKPSAESVFGSKATLPQLWTGDVAALQIAFPDDKGSHVEAFDASSADMALMMHLAFWTGKNCERMKRLFERSGLIRKKWHERPDYQLRTITGAVNLSTSVYQRMDLTVQSSGIIPGENFLAQPFMRQGYQFLTVEGCIQHFAGCVYVRDIHKVFTPDGGLIGPEQFKATYGGYDFSISLDNPKPTKNAWEAFVENKSVTFPKVHQTAFRPETPTGTIVNEEGILLVNTYVPAPIAETEDDVTPFLNHLAKLLPNTHDQQILLSYMAAIKQFPGSKFQWAPVLQGTPGNGKTLFMRCVAKAVGERYTHLPNTKELAEGGSKFTAWIENKLFIGIEEIHVRGRIEIAEVLLPLITNSRIEIQGKGSNQVTGDNRANFFFCSNFLDAVIKTINDRRYSIFYSAQQTKDDLIRDGMIETDYFPNLYNWLRGGGYAAVTGFLRRYVIAPEMNPAIEFGGRSQWAPETSSTTAAIIETLGPIEQTIIEAVAEGRVGFRGDWISSIKLDEFLKDTGKARALPPNRRQAVMMALGYVRHPSLPGGRITRPLIQEDNRKPVLYVRKGSISELNLRESGAIIHAYITAQGWLMEPGQIAANQA